MEFPWGGGGGVNFVGVFNIDIVQYVAFSLQKADFYYNGLC